MGYQLAVCTTLLDLVLIVIVINEARLAPTKPVVTESVSRYDVWLFFFIQLKDIPWLEIRVVLCQAKTGPPFTLNLCLVG